VQAAFIVETWPATRKTQYFVDFYENSDISFLFDTFRSLPLSSLYFHAERSAWRLDVETSDAKRKKQSFADLDETSDISFLIEIFRRWIAPITLFYTPNVVHAAFSVETRPATRKTQPFTDFDENSDISFLFDTFRSLPLSSLYLHVERSAWRFWRRNKRCKTKKAIIRRFRRNLWYFVPAWDIPTIDLSYYSILHAERSAGRF
jgi:hypothetical protein